MREKKKTEKRNQNIGNILIYLYSIVKTYRKHTRI